MRFAFEPSAQFKWGLRLNGYHPRRQFRYAPRVFTTLRQAIAGFPAVLVTGPRQSGKTTEAAKAFMSLGRKPDLYFWRSHDGLEVDLLIMINGKLQPVEIKLTATPLAGHVEPIDRFMAFAGDDATRQGLLVCRTETERALPNGHIAMPWTSFPDWLRARLQAEHVTLSERDSLRVLDALENPPAPNARLQAAARRIPKIA